MIVRNVVEFLNCHIDANDINHGQNCKVCLDQLDCEMAPLFLRKGRALLNYLGVYILRY